MHRDGDGRGGVYDRNEFPLMVLMKVKVKALGGSSLVWMADRERRQCGSLGLEEI
jgi:hypothetical protein